jgi:hypothetical protein
MFTACSPCSTAMVASVVHLCVALHTLVHYNPRTRVVRDAHDENGVDKSVPGEGGAGGGMVVVIMLSFIHYYYYHHKNIATLATTALQ